MTGTLVRRALGAAAVLWGCALPIAVDAVAQDRVGAGVAVVGGDVVALKPTPTRGPPHLLVFRPDGSGWSLTRLAPASGGTVGESLGGSLAVDGSAVIVAAADPDGRWAFHDWRRGADGAWSEAARVLLDPEVPAPDPAAPLDVGAVFRILQPPPRTIAAGAGLAAAVRQDIEPLTVRLYARAGERPGDWTPAGTIRVDGDAPAPVLPALGPDLLALGVPLAGGGHVRLYRRGADGSWTAAGRVAPAGLPEDARFGAAVAVSGDQLLVGAPGLAGGRVIVFDADEGGWTEAQRLDAGPGSVAFGAALVARGGRMLAADPAFAGRRGRVYGFERAQGGRWRATATVDPRAPQPGDLFGAAVALGASDDGVPGAIGAPGVWANLGAVYAVGSDAPRELDHGLTLRAVAEGSEVRCEDGEAAGFACADVDLQAFLTLDALGGGPGERVSDLWGWTDPQTGREYALVGRTGGVVILDVTTPAAPALMGVVPANPSGARDVKVYADHMYFTGDGAGEHGLVVFDLSRLRSLDGPAGALEPDAVYHGVASAHNLAIDAESGFAFAVRPSAGGETCGGGLHMVDIRRPTDPVFAGCYTDTNGLLSPGSAHDAQCVVYRGPDEDYRGRQICLASYETALRIVDVTDKANPVPISAADYPARAYIHQGWLTDDQRYFYLDDEIDELTGKAERTRTTIWDLSDLDDPIMVGEHLGPDNATDHNLYVKGDRMYQANYQAGLRVVDISDPVRPVEVGFFDTTPYEGEGTGFSGAWTAYPFFDSGTVVVTSMNEGVFVLRPRRAELIP